MCEKSSERPPPPFTALMAERGNRKTSSVAHRKSMKCGTPSHKSKPRSPDFSLHFRQAQCDAAQRTRGLETYQTSCGCWRKERPETSPPASIFFLHPCFDHPVVTQITHTAMAARVASLLECDCVAIIVTDGNRFPTSDLLARAISLASRRPVNPPKTFDQTARTRPTTEQKCFA